MNTEQTCTLIILDFLSQNLHLSLLNFKSFNLWLDLQPSARPLANKGEAKGEKPSTSAEDLWPSVESWWHFYMKKTFKRIPRTKHCFLQFMTLSINSCCGIYTNNVLSLYLAQLQTVHNCLFIWWGAWLESVMALSYLELYIWIDAYANHYTIDVI